MSRKLRDVIKGRPVIGMPPETTVRDAARRMKQSGVGSIAITENGTLIGIFTERDGLFRVLAEGLDPDTTPISQVMTSKVTTVPSSTTLAHALHLMFDFGFRHLPVVDDGVPTGMVSIRDAMGEELIKFGRELDHKQKLHEVV